MTDDLQARLAEACESVGIDGGVQCWEQDPGCEPHIGFAPLPLPELIEKLEGWGRTQKQYVGFRLEHSLAHGWIAKYIFMNAETGRYFQAESMWRPDMVTARAEAAIAAVEKVREG